MFNDTLKSLVSSNYIFIERYYLPAEIVQEIMEEDNDNNSFSWTWSSCSVLNSCQSNPCCESTAHASSRGEEKWPTTNTINEEGKTNGFDPVCRADDTIEPVLELWVGDTNISKNFAAHIVSLLPKSSLEIYLPQIVPSKTGTGHLRKESTTKTDKKAFTVSSYHTIN